MADIDFQIPAILTLVTKQDGDGKKKRFFNTTASSTVEDAHGDEFTPDAVEKMASQAKGSRMSIFLNHEYRIPEDLFGTTTDAVAVKRALGNTEAVTDLDLSGFINEANPRARETADALEGGAKLGVSIGARIKDYRPRDEKDPMGGWIINDVELKETSIVGMPANPRTWVHYASKAIAAFDRERVKEAADMTKTATAVAELPVDDSVTEDDAETLALLEANELVDSQKVLSTQNMPGAVSPAETNVEEADPEPEPDPDVEAAEAATSEESAQETESPEDVVASETPAQALSQAIDNSAENLSVAALQIILKDAKDEITKRDESIDQLTQERDAALETLAEATAIIETIATTPLGRKAVVQEQVKDYRSRITGVYDPEFMKFLKGSNPQ
jgi:HK97 family phage prohead protease